MKSFLASLAFGSLAEASQCFREPVWGQDDIQISYDVPFGLASDPGAMELTLDAYLPPDSDTREKRPVAVLVHGGGFVGGDSRSDGQPTFALYLATRGFAVVSINYRQLGEAFDLSTSDVPALSAVEDTRAAVRFVRKMAEDYRLDTDRIMLEGDSAGAITGLYVGYVESAQDEGHSGNPGFRSDVRLVVSVSGQLKNQAYCNRIHPFPFGCQVSGDINHVGEIGTFENQPALFMIHGTEDYTVPYKNGKAVYDAVADAGLPASLVTIDGAAHVPWEEFYASDEYTGQLLDFVYKQLDLENAECPQPDSLVV